MVNETGGLSQKMEEHFINWPLYSSISPPCKTHTHTHTHGCHLYSFSWKKQSEKQNAGENLGSFPKTAHTFLSVHLFNCVWLFAISWTIAYQAPLSMGFFRPEYWSELPFPSPGDLLNPGLESASLVSPALVGEFFYPLSHRGRPHTCF